MKKLIVLMVALISLAGCSQINEGDGFGSGVSSESSIVRARVISVSDDFSEIETSEGDFDISKATLVDRTNSVIDKDIIGRSDHVLIVHKDGVASKLMAELKGYFFVLSGVASFVTNDRIEVDVENNIVEADNVIVDLTSSTFIFKDSKQIKARKIKVGDRVEVSYSRDTELNNENNELIAYTVEAMER